MGLGLVRVRLARLQHAARSISRAATTLGARRREE